MDKRYTSPNEQCARLQEVIRLCEYWITVIRYKEGTSEEREFMEGLDDCICDVVSQIL